MLTLDQLKHCLHEAESAAREAGDWAKAQRDRKVHLNEQFKHADKSLASSIVTDIDLACEAKILSHLEDTAKAFGIAILSEESQADTKDRLNSEYFWAIDPLDGTLPFTEGRDGYSVSIGLVNKQGEAVLGTVYDPEGGILYKAMKDHGAQKNQETLIPKPIPNHPSPRFIMDRSDAQNPNYLKLIDQIQLLMGIDVSRDRYIQPGGAAMNAMRVIELAPAFYLKPMKPKFGGGSIWDFAASSCILREAGAIVTNIFGDPLHLNQPHSNFMNDQGIVMLSHPTLEPFLPW
ncbi:MAG: inositol monophosphatase [Pseudobacteriovorax sp.]|nr:inositol monophosphatase [Pseudobacteriovorax sp.]